MAEKTKRGNQKGRAAVEKKARALERLTVEYVEITSVSPNRYNQNRQSEHDFELLCRSMREDGFTQPIICQRETRQIVDGEHRWRAAAELGYTEIPVVFVDMTPEQMRIATLRHNRARGEEDVDLTAAVLRDLRELGALDWAQDSLMLDDTELQNLLEDVTAPEALAAAEFSDAWEPRPAAVTDADNGDGHERPAVSMTPQTLTEQRRQEARLQAAQTEQERQAIRKEVQETYRLLCVFTGSEARVVKAVLGTEGAQKVLQWCRAEAPAALLAELDAATPVAASA
jgi:ParB/RepB/Spo0J family partition protein